MFPLFVQCFLFISTSKVTPPVKWSVIRGHGLRNKNKDSVFWKHAANEHGGDGSVKYSMKVLKTYGRDNLTRKVNEAAVGPQDCYPQEQRIIWTPMRELFDMIHVCELFEPRCANYLIHVHKLFENSPIIT